MALVTLSEILKDAEKNHYAVGMFDIHNLEMASAAVDAAEEERSPIILALAEVHAGSVRQLQNLADVAVFCGRRAKVPVAVHYDHGQSIPYILQVLHRGFTSVMLDGSACPYRENVEKTREAVRLAKAFGASVEGEIGHVGGSEGEACGEDDSCYTDPEEAKAFCEETQVDALAVAIGTVHGNYRKAPCLDLPRLEKIHAAVGTPLVLHGGSGLSEEDFRNCIRCGISKINIYTEVVQSAEKALRTDCMKGGGYLDILRTTTNEMRGTIAEKLRLFGSAGRA